MSVRIGSNLARARVCGWYGVLHAVMCAYVCGSTLNGDGGGFMLYVVGYVQTHSLANKLDTNTHIHEKKNNINAGSVLCLSTRKQLRRNTPPSTPHPAHHRYPIGLIWTPPQKDDVRRVCVCVAYAIRTKAPRCRVYKHTGTVRLFNTCYTYAGEMDLC